MRISDWSSDVCSSGSRGVQPILLVCRYESRSDIRCRPIRMALDRSTKLGCSQGPTREEGRTRARDGAPLRNVNGHRAPRPGYRSRSLVANERSIQLCRSAEHTYELTSLMRLTYAVFCLK